MENKEIFDKVCDIAKKTFHYDGEITEATKSADIKSWDSMNQVRFLAELEGYFSVKFKVKDILSFSTIGDITNCIERMKK